MLIPLLVATFAYFGLMAFSFLILLPQKFRGPNDPAMLKEHYWKLEPEQAQTAYWTHIEKAYRKTYKTVSSKGRWLRWAVFALALETLALVTWLVLSAIF